MDETNVYYDQKSSYTYSFEGERSIHIATSGSSNRCTVLLAVTASGIKLPPFIIFKGVRDAAIAGECAARNATNVNIYATVQQNAWIDETLMLEWIDKIWVPYVHKYNSYLMLDHASAHLTREPWLKKTNS